MAADDAFSDDDPYHEETLSEDGSDDAGGGDGSGGAAAQDRFFDADDGTGGAEPKPRHATGRLAAGTSVEVAGPARIGASGGIGATGGIGASADGEAEYLAGFWDAVVPALSVPSAALAEPATAASNACTVHATASRNSYRPRDW